MLRILLLSVLLVAVVAAFGQQTNLSIHARIKDLKAGDWVYWRKISDTEKDSVKATDGRFDIRTTVGEGEGNIYILQVGATYKEHSVLVLYLDKGEVEIRGEGPMFDQAKLSGSPYIADFNTYNEFMDKDSLMRAAPALYKEANERYKNKDSVGLAKLQPLMDKTDSMRTVLSKEWVRQHPSSAISAYVLYFVLRRSLSFDELATALGALSPAARDNRLAKEIEHSIAVNKLTGVGQQAMDFSQTDTAGRTVSLRDFRGKYVLVDFWASWCHPCRLENPNVVKAYADYRDKNFTVLGVSLDRPGYKDAWLKAIHDDGLTWTQVSDLKFWNNAIAKQYDIEAIPSNLLIGPDGKIVAKDLHGEELEKKLSEVLSK
ncbi:MAG TPA: TlpA disulfide reductase family protein [Puia sp.]|nr:TlpA disulfide reductase family protein [Puia sp.]